MTKHTILFLAANPVGTDRLALDEEARSIKVALERSGHRDRFELVTRWAVRPMDLLDELRKLKPTVVHFAGRGGHGEPGPGPDSRRDLIDATATVSDYDQYGLFFQGTDGRPHLVSAAALDQTFGAAGCSVKLVILNACYSDGQAEALLARVDCVVGIGGSFSDDAARNFAIGLYGGLGECESVAMAFEQGRAAISLEGLSESERPRLKVREGIDADRLVLADHAALLHDMLARDLAAWGERHVFGNVPRERWQDDEGIPFLPLEKLYVEPDGALEHDRQQQGEPLLALIERLTATSADPQVVVVTADFGSGKSLSARMLACRWAKQLLTSRKMSLEVALPIYVRCADDFPSETVDVELTVRRAWKRQADGIGQSVADDDELFCWPSPEQRVVCLLDGLDEVALGDQHLQTVFQRLRGKTTRNHRFVIFSRPGALPAPQDLGANVVTVQVLPFHSGQVEEWLERWSHLHPDEQPITSADLAERDLATIAQTPILLFMVAFTWGQETTKIRPPSLAEIYERFLHQVASGKAGSDPDPHRPIAVASDRLLVALRNARLLDASAARPDAMLWLMGRVAWEAYMLEQRHPSEPLTRWHVDSMLRDSEVPIPADAIDTIRIGLVLTLQADLRGTNYKILFGHKSFREFLVGRHWATTLRRIVRAHHGSGRAATGLLLGGRLLGREDQSFDYLMQIINAPGEIESCSTAAIGWSDGERERLVRWAQEIFDDEHQEFGERARPLRRVDHALCNDQRAELREAALAIGSMTRGSAGMRASKPLALRSMLAWFWLMGDTATIIGPGATLTGTLLSGASLSGANLCRANLNAADLSGTDLSGANLREAKLSGANLGGADIYKANLRGADLSGAHVRAADLHEANLREANLRAADLRQVDFSTAYLCMADLSAANLSDADLSDADLSAAELSRADLAAANLSEAYLRGANLHAANLHRADFSNAKLIGAELGQAKLNDTNLMGADLRGANLSQAEAIASDLRGADLSGANLREANLREANLAGANLCNANLIGANLIGANLIGANLIGTDLGTTKLKEIEATGDGFVDTIYDETTVWPEGFDPDTTSAARRAEVA